MLLAAMAAGYVVLVHRERRRRRWPAARPALFLVGVVIMATALSPPVDSWADSDFGGHMVQHLLLAMLGPLALVLGAPITLLLRGLPHRYARRLGRLLNTDMFHHLAHPVVALVLSSGGLVLLYFTPLYDLSTRHDGVHLLVHLHLVLAGSLFAWVIAGPDATPRRATVRTRLVVLGIAIAVHASVSQLLYAGLVVQVHEPVEQMRAAGSLMYFGGDIAELLLALAMLITWRQPAAKPRSQTQVSLA
ncbi:MAG: cytochrome c oxidase assembly protein [Ornithinibacter sp.]